MTRTRTVADAVADVVAAHSPVVFSLVGNGNAHFVASLTSRGHRVVSVRHETATVIAAHSFALAGGGIAAATATYGAGFTNLLTSLALALRAAAPAAAAERASPLEEAPLVCGCAQRARLGRARAHRRRLGTSNVRRR